MLVCPIPRPHPPIKAQGPVLPWPVLACPEAPQLATRPAGWNFSHLGREAAMASNPFTGSINAKGGARYPDPALVTLERK